MVVEGGPGSAHRPRYRLLSRPTVHAVISDRRVADARAEASCAGCAIRAP